MPQCILTPTDALSVQILAESLSEQRDPLARQIWEKLKAATIVPALEIEDDRVTLDCEVTFETSDELVHTVRILNGRHSIAREAILPLEHSRAIALLGSRTGDQVFAIDCKGCFELLVVKAVKPVPRSGYGATTREDGIVLLASRAKRGFRPRMYDPGSNDPGPTAA
jgi:transcription elongation GreA/GreB family factor